jgi:hypothetical protein
MRAVRLRSELFQPRRSEMSSVRCFCFPTFLNERCDRSPAFLGERARQAPFPGDASQRAIEEPFPDALPSWANATFPTRIQS